MERAHLRENNESREMPNSVEAERAVLGAILLDPSNIGKTEELDPEHFFHRAHRSIYSAMREISEEGMEPDHSSVIDRLKNKEELESAGGRSYISTLADSSLSPAYLDQHVRRVREKHLLRELIMLCHETAQEAYGDTDLLELVEETQQQLSDIALWSSPEDFVDVKRGVRGVMEESHELYTKRQQGDDTQISPGLPTGYGDLDRMTGGLTPKELTILAARPAVGKTSLAINIALRQAAEGKRVGFFSLEMGAERLIMRMLAIRSEVNSRKIERGDYDNNEEITRVSKAVQDLSKRHIYIDESSGLKASTFKSKARKLREDKGVDVIMIDYLQLMNSDDGDNRQEEVSHISRTLKQIARELQIPVLSLAQLNRSVENRGSKEGKKTKPVLSDLRESGSLEQDADVVLFLYQGGDVQQTAGRLGPEQDINLYVAKNRNGPTGEITLRFFPDKTRFEQSEMRRDQAQGTG